MSSLACLVRFLRVDTEEGLGTGQRRPLHAGNDTRAACGRVHLGCAGDFGCLLNYKVLNPILEAQHVSLVVCESQCRKPESLTRSRPDQETCFDVIFVMELLSPKSWFRVKVPSIFWS